MLFISREETSSAGEEETASVERKWVATWGEMAAAEEVRGDGGGSDVGGGMQRQMKRGAMLVGVQKAL